MQIARISHSLQLSVRSIFQGLLFLFTAWLLIPYSRALAQAPDPTAAPERLLIYSAEMQEEGDLQLIFSVLDEDGLAVTQPIFDQGEVDLGELGGSIPIQLQKVNIPLYLVLVLDASGSISSVSEELKEAVIGAVDQASENTYFSVIQFHRDITILQSFSEQAGQKALAIEAINRYSMGYQGTCLYDAAYEATELLSAIAASRKAVVLFTDGHDEIRNENGELVRCSERSIQEPINLARSAGIPIYTLGLSAGNAINFDHLEELAGSTGGLFLVDASLGTLFREMMESFNSQWLAEAAVFPPEGEHHGELKIWLNDSLTPLSASFAFIAEKSYNASTDTAISLTIRDDPDNPNFFQMEIRMTNPETVDHLSLLISTGNLTIFEEDDIAASSRVLLAVPKDLFDTNGSYLIVVQGHDRNHLVVLDLEGNPLETTQDFRPELQEFAFGFEIESVLLEDDVQRVRLRTFNEHLIASYSIWLVDELGYEVPGSRMSVQAPADPAGIPLDLDALKGGGYVIQIQAIGVDGFVSSPQSKEIIIQPPGLMARIAEGLAASPWIVVMIFILVLAIILFFVFENRRKQREQSLQVLTTPAEIPAPLKGRKTEAFRPVPAPASRPRTAPRGSLKVVASPDSKIAGRDIPIHAPFTIGRYNCSLNIRDDRISGKHARITYDARKDVFFIEDEDSLNGTFVNGNRITSAPITTGTEIRLGPRTLLEFRES